jgi:uncharacterized membrane protein
MKRHKAKTWAFYLEMSVTIIGLTPLLLHFIFIIIAYVHEKIAGSSEPSEVGLLVVVLPTTLLFALACMILAVVIHCLRIFLGSRQYNNERT